MSDTKSLPPNYYENGFASYKSTSTRKAERGHNAKNTLNATKSNSTDNSQNNKNTAAKHGYFRWNSK